MSKLNKRRSFAHADKQAHINQMNDWYRDVFVVAACRHLVSILDNYLGDSVQLTHASGDGKAATAERCAEPDKTSPRRRPRAA